MAVVRRYRADAMEIVTDGPVGGVEVVDERPAGPWMATGRPAVLPAAGRAGVNHGAPAVEKGDLAMAEVGHDGRSVAVRAVDLGGRAPGILEGAPGNLLAGHAFPAMAAAGSGRRFVVVRLEDESVGPLGGKTLKRQVAGVVPKR